MTNPVVVMTNPVIFRTNPVTLRTNPVSQSLQRHCRDRPETLQRQSVTVRDSQEIFQRLSLDCLWNVSGLSLDCLCIWSVLKEEIKGYLIPFFYIVLCIPNNLKYTFIFLAMFTKCLRQVQQLKVLNKDHEDLC